ncbi:hypothetical protein [Corallincola holothuriorum]|nr:hypothetical protein [Corallincola holothuriorum]
MRRQLIMFVMAILLSACTTTRYVAVPVSEPDAELGKRQAWLTGIESGDTLVLHTHEGKSYFFTLDKVLHSDDSVGFIPKDRPSMVEIHQMEGRKKMEPVISADDATPVGDTEFQLPWWSPSVIAGAAALLLLL